MSKPDWQNQSMKKVGAAAPVNRMNAKLTGGMSSSLHSKICAPTYGFGGDTGAKMARPVLKMADGGMVDTEFGDYDNAVNANSDNGEWARGENYGDGTTGDERVEMARKPVDTSSMKMPTVEDEPAEREAPAKAMSFKEAFAANRKAGAKTFEWNGKKYTTDIATSKPAAKPAAAPKAETKSSGMSLAQSKGAEYQTMSRIADEAEKNPNASLAAKQAARKNADKARSTYEAAADAEKTGRSVVFKR